MIREQMLSSMTSVWAIPDTALRSFEWCRVRNDSEKWCSIFSTRYRGFSGFSDSSGFSRRSYGLDRLCSGREPALTQESFEAAPPTQLKA